MAQQRPDSQPYVGRAGRKLQAALDAFDLDVTDLRCADFGCNVGGFTDCLLRRGAARVYAVDTGYGCLAWRLRNDPRVVVMERTNALHAPRPEPIDLVVVDVAWTPQRRIVPAALRWLRPDVPGPIPPRIVSLLKPHYEWSKLHGRRRRAPLDPDEARQTCRTVCRDLTEAGAVVRTVMPSPLRGKGGNVEYLLEIVRPPRC